MSKQWLFLVGLLAVSGLPVAQADDGDHDRARQALEAGEVLPLPRILQAVGRDHPGQVIGVELERHRERWIYEIKMLQNDGRLLKLKVDAREATILAVKGRDGRDQRRREHSLPAAD
ncbi:MAG: hypothetical protein JNL84_13350 [Candidatus Accumulibacter sp.]|nr:hypothetical protein [Accumulibacter sp.]